MIQYQNTDGKTKTHKICLCFQHVQALYMLVIRVHYMTKKLSMLQYWPCRSSQLVFAVVKVYHNTTNFSLNVTIL